MGTIFILKMSNEISCKIITEQIRKCIEKLKTMHVYVKTQRFLVIKL